MTNNEITLLRQQKRRLLKKYNKKIKNLNIQLDKLRLEKKKEINKIEEEIRNLQNTIKIEICELCGNTQVITIDDEDDIICHECYNKRCNNDK